MKIYHCKTKLEYEIVIYYLQKIKKYKNPFTNFDTYKEDTCVVDYDDGFVLIVDIGAVKLANATKKLVQFRPPVSIAALINMRVK